MKAIRNEIGLVEIEPIVLRKPSLDDVLQAVEELNSATRPLHEFVRATSLREDNRDGWKLITPDGREIFMTAHAFKQYPKRVVSMRKSRPDWNGRREVLQPIGFWPCVETDIGLVANATMSDCYGLAPDTDLIRLVIKAVDSVIDWGATVPRASIHPDRVEMTVQMKTIEIETPKVGDEMGVGFTLVNSHTGKSSVRLIGWNEIMFCLNGQVHRNLEHLVAIPHKVSGLDDWTHKSLSERYLSGDIMGLTEGVKNTLAKGSRLKMQHKVKTDLVVAVQDVWEESLEVAAAAQVAAQTELTLDQTETLTKKLFTLLFDEKRSKALGELFDMKQSPTLTNNMYKVMRITRNALNKYNERLGPSVWSVASAFNDRPELDSDNIPASAQAYLVEFSSALFQDPDMTTALAATALVSEPSVE